MGNEHVYKVGIRNDKLTSIDILFSKNDLEFCSVCIRLLIFFMRFWGLFVFSFLFRVKYPVNVPVSRLQSEWTRSPLRGHVIGGQLRDPGRWFREDLRWQAQVPLLQLCYERHSATH